MKIINKLIARRFAAVFCDLPEDLKGELSSWLGSKKYFLIERLNECDKKSKSKKLARLVQDCHLFGLVLTYPDLYIGKEEK